VQADTLTPAGIEALTGQVLALATEI